MRICVTGASGAIDRLLVPQLVADGRPVAPMTRARGTSREHIRREPGRTARCPRRRTGRVEGL